MDYSSDSVSVPDGRDGNNRPLESRNVEGYTKFASFPLFPNMNAPGPFSPTFRSQSETAKFANAELYPAEFTFGMPSEMNSRYSSKTVSDVSSQPYREIFHNSNDSLSASPTTSGIFSKVRHGVAFPSYPNVPPIISPSLNAKEPVPDITNALRAVSLDGSSPPLSKQASFDEGTNSPNFLASLHALVSTQLGQLALVFDILVVQHLPWLSFLEFKAEGCPFCLHRPVSTQKSPFFVILRCKSSGCTHVAHLCCIAPAQTSLSQKSVRLNLQNDHSTGLNFLQPSDVPLSSLVASIESSSNSGHRQRCVYELTFSHFLNETPVSRFASTFPVDSLTSNPHSEIIVFLNTDAAEQARMGIHFDISRCCFRFRADCASTEETWDFRGTFDLLKCMDPVAGSSVDLMVDFPQSFDQNVNQARLIIRVACVKASDISSSFSASNVTTVNPSLCTPDDISKELPMFRWTLTDVVLQLFYLPLSPEVKSLMRNPSIGYVSPELKPVMRPASIGYPLSHVGMMHYDAPNFAPRSKSMASIMDPQQLVNHLTAIDRRQQKLKLADDEVIEQILEVVVGRIADLAMSQSGSRFLQEKLAIGDMKYIELIFSESYEVFPLLMVNLFGNYFVQKLVEYCDETQLMAFASKMKDEFSSIACDKQGTRAMQRMIEACSVYPDIRTVILNSVDSNAIVDLVCDPNATHVMVSIISSFPITETYGIFVICFDSVAELAIDPHGLCMLKKCLTLSNQYDVTILSDLFEKVLPIILTVTNDPYGNYLVQHLLDLDQIPNACAAVHNCLKQNYSFLSRQKFSSNVIERILRLVSYTSAVQFTEKNTILEDIMNELLDERQIVMTMDDQYGNFVMQHALEMSSPANKKKMIEVIYPVLQSLKKGFHKRWYQLIRMTHQSFGGPSNQYEIPASMNDPVSHRVPRAGSHQFQNDFAGYYPYQSAPYGSYGVPMYPVVQQVPMNNYSPNYPNQFANAQFTSQSQSSVPFRKPMPYRDDRQNH